MKLNKLDEELHKEASDFVSKKANKKAIAKKWVDCYLSEKYPVSVFMAGSPGAGKTEAAKELIKSLGGNILRIDNDELRNEFKKYNGANSYVFQEAATKLVETIHDRALKLNVSFILDSTLSSYEKAKQNISRSLDKKRIVQVIFIYQDPEKAWQFVMAREKEEGRYVPKEVFVHQFLSSREVVNKLKDVFGRRIRVDVVTKNFDGSKKIYYTNVNSIDTHVSKVYDELDLKKIVGLNIRSDGNVKKNS